MNNTNVIYCYVKRDTQEVVYVGQTVNLKTRRLKHKNMIRSIQIVKNITTRY